MKIALITRAPVALEYGGAATYNRAICRLLTQLPGGAEVTEIPIRDKPSSTPHRLRQVLSLARATLSSHSAKALFNLPPGILPRLERRIAAASPDLVVISSADLLFCRAVTGKVPTAVVTHNVEQVLYARQIEAEARRVPLVQQFLRADLKKLRHMETEGLKAASLIIAISTVDAAWFKNHGISTPVFVMPPTIPGPLPIPRRPPAALPLRLALIAKLSWWPNRLGCEWLMQEILAKLPPGTAELNVYGPGSEAINAPSRGVNGHGFVDRLEDVWTNNHISVCPVDQGSGVNVKLVESLVNGIPVLTTSFGVRGLPLIAHDPAVHICDGANAWIEYLRSAEALALAGRTPDDVTRNLFLDETYLGPLAARIRETIPSARRQFA